MIKKIQYVFGCTCNGYLTHVIQNSNGCLIDIIKNCNGHLTHVIKN